MGKIEQALEESIDEAVNRGIIDRKLHAAPLAVMLSLAKTIDTPTFPIVEDKYDNVSIPTLLRYMQSMGLTLHENPRAKQEKAETVSKLASMKERSRARLNVV